MWSNNVKARLGNLLPRFVIRASIRLSSLSTNFGCQATNYEFLSKCLHVFEQGATLDALKNAKITKTPLGVVNSSLITQIFPLGKVRITY